MTSSHLIALNRKKKYGKIIWSTLHDGKTFKLNSLTRNKQIRARSHQESCRGRREGRKGGGGGESRSPAATSC